MKVDQVELVRCHWALLRLAGTAPDDLLTQCRRWLAQGRVVDVARATARAAVSHRVKLAQQEIDVIAGVLASAGHEVPMLQTEDAADEHPAYAFAAARVLMEAGDGSSEPVTATVLAAAARPEDVVDAAAIAAARSETDVLAVWRSWRFQPESPWPPPQRVFVVETDRDADLPLITGRMQDALAVAGETRPQVESYPIQAELPEYQQYARLAGGLIWARTPDPGIRIATIFDSFDDNGEPQIAPDHPKLDQPQAQQLLAYLDQGQQILISQTAVPDAVDPTRGASVPTGLRTDGFWIWSDASSYYLRQHGLSPEAGLVEHVRQRDYHVSVVDGAGIYRALVALHVFGADGAEDADGAGVPGIGDQPVSMP